MAVLVLAPVGRDAETVLLVLSGAGIDARTATGSGALCDGLAHADALVVAEEALIDGLDRLAACLAAQPPWSDVPVLVLTAGGQRGGTEARWRLFERLGNVTLLDRPLHAETLRSAVRAALRARGRQRRTRLHLEEIERAAALLEERVAERSRELRAEAAERGRAEAALMRAQRLEAVGQLTGGVAHDFNNLLQVVLGGIHLLRRGGGDPGRLGKTLTAMEQATERGARLVQQMLAFARRQPLAAEPVDLFERIGAMRELLRGSLRGDIVLDVALPGGLPPVRVDPGQLEAALVNLAVNARDAMPDGGVLAITAENASLPAGADPDEPSGEFVRLSVSDTGTGMAPETLAKAFEPFFTTKPVGRGTGLGLSQVHGFARQSGGLARIDSAPGRGSRVSLLLPRSAEPARLQPAVLGDGPAGPGGDLRPLRILVVEDDGHVAGAAAAALQELGHEAVTAASAAAALEALSGGVGVDLLFTDVVMPGAMDGLDLVRRVRGGRPGLPVLLTSGYPGIPERLAGAPFPLLRKPYSIEELRQAIRNATIVRPG